MAADLVVVADHHQIVDLGSLADPGGLERGPVDRAVRADLHVAADLEPPGMRDLDMPAVHLAIAKPVSAQHGAGVDLDAVVEDDIGIEYRVGMDHAFLPDPAPIADHGAGIEGCSIANLGLSLPRKRMGKWPRPAPICADGATQACG